MNEKIESRKPPVATTGIIGWLRINLFFKLLLQKYYLFSEIRK